MLRCIPFLLFDGNCTEAVTLYYKCLGGEFNSYQAWRHTHESTVSTGKAQSAYQCSPGEWQYRNFCHRLDGIPLI